MDDLDKELMEIEKQERERNKNRKDVDSYFEFGEKAQALWRDGKKEQALTYANKQINWYRDAAKREKLELDLAGVLPRKILGLDTIILALQESGKFDEAIKLVKEFHQITDKDGLYNDDLIKRINKRLK